SLATTGTLSAAPQLAPPVAKHHGFHQKKSSKNAGSNQPSASTNASSGLPFRAPLLPHRQRLAVHLWQMDSSITLILNMVAISRLLCLIRRLVPTPAYWVWSMKIPYFMRI